MIYYIPPPHHFGREQEEKIVGWYFKCYWNFVYEFHLAQFKINFCFINWRNSILSEKNVGLIFICFLLLGLFFIFFFSYTIFLYFQYFFINHSSLVICLPKTLDLIILSLSILYNHFEDYQSIFPLLVNYF